MIFIEYEKYNNSRTKEMLMNSAIYCIAGMYLHVLIQVFKVQHLAIRDKYLINCIGVGPKCLDTGKFSRGQY